MSHQSLTGRFLSARARGILAGLAALTISIPSVWADAQSDINALLGTKTILTAKAADLAAAVATLATTSTNFTPAQYAAAAFEPFNAKVRADRNTSAPVVVDAVTAAFLAQSGTNPNFGATIASVVGAVVTVNAGNSKTALSVTGQGAVVKGALGTASDSVGTTGTGGLAADASIGAALAADSLNTANGANFVKFLQAGIVGINGVKGKSTTNAPQATELFVQGLLSGGTIPGGTVSPAGYSAFAVNILKSVSKNASVDELVAYTVGTKLNNQTDWVTLTTALVTKYTTAATVAKIVQGVTADTTAALGEVARGNFLNALTISLKGKDEVAIDQGGTYVDPIYSGSFTQQTFAALVTLGGNKLATKDAAAIATGEGNILGQDGDMLTQVAASFAALTGTNILPPASSSTYAKDLITGAVKSKIPSSAFTGAAAGLGGGTLNVGTGKFGTTVSNEVAMDLSSILDLFAKGILNSTPLTTAADVKAVSTDIGNLAKAVATFVKNESSTAGGTNQPVAAYLAGVLTNVVSSIIGLSSPSAFTAIQAAISKDVQAVTQSTKNANVDALVAAAVTNFNNGAYPLSPTSGALGVVESPVTNL